MSSNVGLSTPRGSGTSGYVQRNMSYLRPRNDTATPRDLNDMKTYRQRVPDQTILDHDRKRQVEIECFKLQDQLEDEGLDEEIINKQVQQLREKLLKAMDKHKGAVVYTGGLKPHQVHELAAAKIVETERLRNALGISLDYEEGSHWKRQSVGRGRRQESKETQSEVDRNNPRQRQDRSISPS